MQTEKRLVLCFALSMLIIFAFSWWNAKNLPNQAAPESVDSTITTAPSQPVLTEPQPVQTPPGTPTDSVANPVAAASASAAFSSWDWLPTAPPAGATQEITVESPLYKVVFSNVGAMPVSWQLIKYPELLADPRYLRLEVDKGPLDKQQLSQLELDLMKEHQDGQVHYVEAIDSVFPRGKAGLQLRWGSSRDDQNIPYTCSNTHFQITEPTPIRFTYESNGLILEKTFRFYPDSYHLDFDIRIINQTGHDIPFSQDNFYDVLWMGGFGFPSLRIDAQNSVHVQREGSVATQTFDRFIQEIRKADIPLLKEYFSPMQLVPGKDVGWVSIGEKYFLSAIIPKIPTRMELRGFSTPGDFAEAVFKPDVGVRINMNSIGNGEVHEDQFVLYVGPISEDELAKAGEGLEDVRQIFLRSIVGPIAHIMLRLLQGLYWIVPNYGLAIIVLTILMKLLMFPVYKKQIQTTKKMQELQPQINALKEKYKDDQQKLQKEQMELFRKHKVNPLSGCLTMLTTIPVFIALYATFAMAVELRGAPFFGWIHDLSQPDMAFFIPLGFTIIPVNILPIAYALLMLWSTSQQKMEGPNAAAMKFLPLIFVFFFWSIASGVILYFVISIFLDVCQRLAMDKMHRKEPQPAK